MDTQSSEIQPEVAIGILIVGLIAAAIGIAIAVFYLLTLQKCLKGIAAENRTMEPAMVWLNLIPLFGMGWIIYTVLQIAQSLQNEQAVRPELQVGDGGKQIGLIYSISALASIIPLVGLITSLVSLVCWILYWVKIAGFNKQLHPQA